MYVHLEPITESVFIGRGYDTPGGYEARLPFRLVFVGVVVDPEEVYLCGALRREGIGLRPCDLQDIARALMAYGYKRAAVERHGRKKVWQLDRCLT
jgi:hypothetical protein